MPRLASRKEYVSQEKSVGVGSSRSVICQNSVFRSGVGGWGRRAKQRP